MQKQTTSSQTVATVGQNNMTATPLAMYLDLVKKCLTKTIYREPALVPLQQQSFLKKTLVNAFAARRIQLVHVEPFDLAKRMAGHDWPPVAHTMIGIPRLDNVQFCCEDVIKRRVPGDFIETGVWRGGATILMRAVLKAYGVIDRHVWVADSFEGFPPPNADKYPIDAIEPCRACEVTTSQQLQSISLEEVMENFAAYGLLDDQVKFLKGWFSETLPNALIDTLAVARLDSGTYESTMEVLTTLYPKLSVGGYLIVDDYGAFAACRQAVDDYRAAHHVRNEIRVIDAAGVYWQRTA
jgi:O-methyltransferase